MKNRPYNAPIESYPLGDGRKKYIRYADEEYSIFKNELSPEELTNLRSTIEMLGRYRGIPSNAWLEEVISNLEYRFGVKSNSENLIEFEQNERLTGLGFLSDLIDATVNHQPLSVTYHSFSGSERTSTVHPYYIKQYNNRWFLFGMEENPKYGNPVVNKALDRIVRFEVLKDVAFVPNDKVNFKDFFKDIVGVTIPEDHPKPERVVLKFDGARFPYIVSKPIHHTQEVVDVNEHTISIMVRPNLELESKIFSFVPQVEVLEPQWLRKEIASKIEENLKKYLSVQFDCTEGA